eukprot:3440824-Prymnesium_polylepis.1
MTRQVLKRSVSLSVTHSTKLHEGSSLQGYRATALETIKNEFGLLRYSHRHLQVPTILSRVPYLAYKGYW